MQPIRLIEPVGYSRYLFKFTIPSPSDQSLEAIVAYNRVTSNILTYIEKRVNTQLIELHAPDIQKYIGVVIENSIYDMFTNLEGFGYGDDSMPRYDDIDEYVVNNGEQFRQDLYLFVLTVINSCIPELSKLHAASVLVGTPIETYSFSRSKTEPQTLEVYGYLEKII